MTKRLNLKGSGHVLSNHVAVIGWSCKTFRPRRSSSVTVLKKREVIGPYIITRLKCIEVPFRNFVPPASQSNLRSKSKCDLWLASTNLRLYHWVCAPASKSSNVVFVQNVSAMKTMSDSYPADESLCGWNVLRKTTVATLLCSKAGALSNWYHCRQPWVSRISLESETKRPS